MLKLAAFRSAYLIPLLCAAAFTPTLPMWSPPAHAADIQEYNRKNISFFQSETSPLNEALVKSLQQELPRFSYQLIGTPLEGDLLQFLGDVKRYQRENAGSLAAMNEQNTLNFGDKVVLWSDTKRIIESGYVMAPQWSYSPLELSGPNKKGSGSNMYWSIDVESRVTVNVPIYKLAGDTPTLYNTVSQSWKVVRELPVGDIQRLLKIVQEATGVEVDLENPVQRAVVLEVVKKIPAFEEILNTDPKAYMQESANKSITANQFGMLARDIKALDEFTLKGGIRNADMRNDKIEIGFGEKETAESLGVRMDSGYKIIEYQQRGGEEIPVEVGFAKVRDLGQGKVTAQPIIVGRDFELGDQIKEYPKLGLNVGIKAGTTSLGLQSFAPNYFVPAAQLDLEYNLAPLLNLSEFYLVASGGATLPMDATSFTLPAFQQPGFPAQPQLVFPQGTQILAYTGELGLMKKWYLRQWILNLSARGGILGGMTLPSPFQPSQPADALTYGGTFTAGAYYQITPDMIVGLDGGFRYFMDGPWLQGGFPAQLPPINSIGPVIHFFFNYAI
jgi:hypothetical protein